MFRNKFSCRLSNDSAQACRASTGTFVSAAQLSPSPDIRNVAFPTFTAASPNWVQVSRVPRPDRCSPASGMGSPLRRGHFGSQAEGLVSAQQNSQWGKSPESTEVRATASFQPADVCEAGSPHNKNTLGKCLLGVVCLNWPDESHFDWGTAGLRNGGGQFQGKGQAHGRNAKKGNTDASWCKRELDLRLRGLCKCARR